MKLGQTLSVFEAAVPDEVAAPYREALVKLQEEAPPISGTPLPLLNGAPGWHSLAIGPPEALVATAVDGVPLVVANVDGTLLAYRNACADCGGTLDGSPTSW